MLEGQFKNVLDMMFMGEETNGFSDQKNTTDIRGMPECTVAKMKTTKFY